MTRDPARSTDRYSRFSILLEISCPRSWPSLNSDYALRTVSPPPNLHSPVIRGLLGIVAVTTGLQPSGKKKHVQEQCREKTREGDERREER